mgnify:CR=1 FL=1
MNISKNKVIISFINSIVIYKLDKKFETSFLTETITLLAIFLAMYSLIKQANRIND